jgi:hypothetical protein
MGSSAATRIGQVSASDSRSALTACARRLTASPRCAHEHAPASR